MFINSFLRIKLTLLTMFSFYSFAQQHTFSSFSPSHAGTGDVVTLRGTNFTGVTAVNFGGVAASSYSIINSTTILAVVGAGNSGSVSIGKTGFSSVSRTGFTYSALPTVTGIITDYGSFWSTTTTTNSPIWPDNSHNLLSFSYKGGTYSTGVNDPALSTNGVVFTAGNFKALPVELNGLSAGDPNLIVAAAKIDGSSTTAIRTHPNIKDMTIQSSVIDGVKGLDLGTGYTNLPSGASSNYYITNINPTKISDDEPDILVTQIAEPTGTATDAYAFLDASNNVIGNSVQVSLANLTALGTYRLDLFSVPPNLPFNAGKPSGVWQTNSTRQVRFVAFRLSDFGINGTNYTQVKTLRITPSGVSDVAFVAYNANAIDALPVVLVDVTMTNTVVCNVGGGPAQMGVQATAPSGDPISFRWQESLDNGVTWNDVSDGGIYSGATTPVLYLSDGTTGRKYRSKVTVTTSGYIVYSPEFTITGVNATVLAGTLNPTGFTNCLNPTSGTTSLNVSPTGGTGTYSYVWEQSNDIGGPFTPISGANTNSYTPLMNVAGTKYYRVRITSGCHSHVSTVATVTINGHSITGVVDGIRCNTGTVGLSATASGGTISWFAAESGGSALTTGPNYTTPSLSATRQYFASTTISGCTSPRVPVNAIVTSGTTLNSTNFNIIFASDVCAGSPSSVSFSTSGLVSQTYTVNYTISGANSFSDSKVVNLVDGYAAFQTEPLVNNGSNTITINSVKIGDCTINVGSGNTSTIEVFEGVPNIDDLNISVSNGCSNISNVATLTSTSLANGIYVVSYAVTGTNSISSSAQVNFNSGSGTFQLPGLLNFGNSNVLTIQSISLLSSPSCIGYPNISSAPFSMNAATLLNSGSDVFICTTESSANITSGSSASNFNSLSWTTSGTGTFLNNTTGDALTNTIYQPSAADKAAGTVILSLNATANTGCQNQVSSINFVTHPLSVGGTISGSTTVCTGTNSTTLTLSGHTGSVTRWEWSTVSDFSSNVNNIANTTTSLNVVNLNSNRFYRALITSGTCAPVYSSIASIAVSPATVAGTVSGSATVCSGTNSTTLTLSGNTGSIVRWQSSPQSEFSSGVQNIANTTTSLTATNLTSTLHYRAVVQSGVCGSLNSSVGTITVNPISEGGVVSGTSAVCIGQNSATLSVAGTQGDIQWFSSPNNVTFTLISGETSTTLNRTNLSSSTYFRVTSTSGVCSSANSNSFLVNVVSPSVGVSLEATDYVWRGSDVQSTDSVDWMVTSNWYVYDGENYNVANALPTRLTNVYIPSTSTCFKANPHIFTETTPESKNLTILPSGHLTMHTGKLSVAGNWVNNGLFTAGNGEVIFVEKGYHTIGGTVSVNAFHDLRMNKVKDGSNLSVAYLLKQATISGELTLTHGAFDINQFSIDMDDRAVNGGNFNSYVRTSGVGFLRRFAGADYNNTQAGYVIFPVGRSRYNPCWIDNSGVSDKFSVRLFDKVTDDSREDSPMTGLPAVERTWLIEEEIKGGSDVRMRLYWNGTFSERIEEINSFDYNSAYIAHYASTKNDWENKGGSAPGGPGYALQSGINDFSPFTISSEGGLGWGSPLPVELLSFSAKCTDEKTVKLDWSTASEKDASHFDVLKSTDGENWSMIEQVPASGNSNTLLNYSFLDRNSVNGNQYYRLKQFDFDGKFEYLPMALANCDDLEPSNSLNVYPNPSENIMFIEYFSSINRGKASLIVQDAKGIQVFERKILIEEGKNFLSIEDLRLTPGIYFVSIKNESFKTNVEKQIIR